MAEESNRARKVDPGLFALMVMLRSHGNTAGNTAEVDSVRDLCGSDTVGIAEILRCARALGFKAYSRTAKWHHLQRLPLPLIAATRDGGFLIIMKVVKNDRSARGQEIEDRGRTKPDRTGWMKVEAISKCLMPACIARLIGERTGPTDGTSNQTRTTIKESPTNFRSQLVFGKQ